MEDDLILKDVKEEDWQLLLKLADYPVSQSQAKLFAMRFAFDGNRHMLVLWQAEVIGMVELHGSEVGYRIKKAYRCKGFATRALSLFLKICGKDEVKAYCNNRNVASCRVLMKNGFDKVKEEEGICQYVWQK